MHDDTTRTPPTDAAPVFSGLDAGLAAALAAHAGAADAAGQFPAASLAALRGAGLLRLGLAGGGVPLALGAAVLAVAETARHCATTALGLGMHLAASLWAGALADTLALEAPARRLHARQRARHRARIADEGRLYTLALPELPGCAPQAAAHGVLARRVEGGHLLHGRQPLLALAGVADCYVLPCTPDRPGATAQDTLLLAVDAQAGGVSLRGEWDAMGLRGLAVHELLLHDVFVPDLDGLVPEGAYAPAAARWPHLQLLALAPAMGLAQAACDQGLALLRSGAGAAPRRDAAAHQAVARMQLLLGQARAVFLQAVQAAAPAPGPAHRHALLVAQHTLPRHAQALGALALQAGGAAALQRTQPLERLLRDACSLAALLPCHPGAALEQLGREWLDTAADRPPEVDVW